MSALKLFVFSQINSLFFFFSKSILFFSHLLCYWLTGEPRFSLNVSQETAWCLTWLIPHNSQRSTFNERWGLVWAGSCTQRGNSLAKALGWFWVPGDGSALLHAACTRLSGGWLRLHLRSSLPVATSVRICISWNKPPLAWSLSEFLLTKYWWWKYSKNNREDPRIHLYPIQDPGDVL